MLFVLLKADDEFCILNFVEPCEYGMKEGSGIPIEETLSKTRTQRQINFWVSFRFSVTKELVIKLENHNRNDGCCIVIQINDKAVGEIDIVDFLFILLEFHHMKTDLNRFINKLRNTLKWFLQRQTHTGWTLREDRFCMVVNSKDYVSSIYTPYQLVSFMTSNGTNICSCLITFR